MIELCTYCGREHETGDINALDVGGVPIKICPEVPPNLIVGYASTNPATSATMTNLGFSDDYGILEVEVIE